ncbi:MAG: hypothetical protein EXR75_15175 [Myxococcales bacterium]|nr:hypothetical protein [Myxococcales bacterium]
MRPRRSAEPRFALAIELAIELAVAVALAFATPLTLTGCAAPPSRLVTDDSWLDAAPLGAAPDAFRSTRTALIPESRRVRWNHADAVATLERAPGRDRSDHLDGSFERTVHVNDEARGYLTLKHRAARPTVPPGALVVQHHYQPGSSVPAVTFAMLKLAEGERGDTDGWRFYLLDSQMRNATDGQLFACARCHAESPRDALFGPPALDPPQ